ncbi:zinc metalloprotease [Pseudonocardia lacus]|uniref:zinc metalloprotease n=1 Tax=Pseudonocardia lacus TaxID=2835865 RepID=UPI001BDD76DE|nr:zinc metalloprotease [Pseudonocardia lacus]
MADSPVPSVRRCATPIVHERLLRTAPGYREARERSENAAWSGARGTAAQRPGVTRIPVVVHVVHNTPEQDISAEQVRSQITALTADYRARNADIGQVPEPFAPLVGDARIEFALATTDPDGNPTDGITRTATDVALFADDDAVKSAATGGADPWPTDRYLNLWVAPLVEGLFGYAQMPGGPPETDGVVIAYIAFGTLGTVSPPFHLGRVATHEIGHWLNLLHIWGDDGDGCNGTDFVEDTPPQAGPNVGAPEFPHFTCDNGPNGDLFVNFMDFTDDPVMVMFTQGQVARMQACLDTDRPTLGTQLP